MTDIARAAAPAAHPELPVDRLVRRVVAGAVPTRVTTRAPFTGAAVADLPESTPEDVATAYERARVAQQRWAERPVGERAAVFLRFHDRLLARQDEILDIIQTETGKVRKHAFEEVLDVALTCRHYGRRARGYLRTRRRAGALPVLTKAVEVRHPKGVVGLVSPWNYPLALSIGDAIPAMIAGNAVVMKPDTQTALTALWALDVATECGLPEDLWQIVIGDGPVVGPAVVAHADYVCFTGSTRTGRQVAQQAAARLVGASLELGGKNAMIVLPDADLDRAAEGAVRACFSSAGQLCVSIERMFVHADVHDQFLERFLARVEGMRLAAGYGWDADMGSLTSRRQLENVSRHVDQARENGAKVLTGGRARPDIGPLFYEPTVLQDVTPGMAVCAEETFGPVVSVYPFTDVDEVVERANATAYGLNASVWTRDTARGARLARRLHAGSVNVNEGYAASYGSAGAPMGGMGDSGLGRRHGVEGITKFTEAQTVATQRVIPIAAPFGMTDEQWARSLTLSLRIMKTFGVR
ncbi:succinic semialdehyde dehydrogenase [Yinghuangia soli]|uniref:succinate-semialdehyde dehydrogenase (NADP(+)) n=1 Tax=Yinghuangia soli TaxID=2908204 RepID=A0AA41Q1Z3_9ACTN|nr:succinic semialdehyde dehydrogenase [Yinghuangia soli]MCF2530074.1 succinate-semialdehyde dehydrogenase (NADP(+)) [Yinghuangia soli]